MFHGGPGGPGRGGYDDFYFANGNNTSHSIRVVYPGNHPSGARFDPFGPVGPGFGNINGNPRPDHFRPPDWGDDMYG